MTYLNVAVYRVGMFGVHRINCKTLTIETGQKYAQHTDAIRYQLMEKGKRKPVAYVLADGPSSWMRVVDLADGKAPQPADGMVANGPGSKMSKYTSMDMRYVTDFEDALAASGALLLFQVGSGHRGDCGCGLCAGRMREAIA